LCRAARHGREQKSPGAAPQGDGAVHRGQSMVTGGGSMARNYDNGLMVSLFLTAQYGADTRVIL